MLPATVSPIIPATPQGELQPAGADAAAPPFLMALLAALGSPAAAVIALPEAAPVEPPPVALAPVAAETRAGPAPMVAARERPLPAEASPLPDDQPIAGAADPPVVLTATGLALAVEAPASVPLVAMPEVRNGEPPAPPSATSARRPEHGAASIADASLPAAAPAAPPGGEPVRGLPPIQAAAEPAAPSAEAAVPPGPEGSPPASATHHAPAPARETGGIVAPAAAPPSPLALPRPTLPLVAAGIVVAVAREREHLTLQLEPAELGRVDVALRVDDGGRLHAAFSIERPETLSLLQREVRGLEQTLAGSGLQLADAGLSFSLRREGGQPGGAAPARGSAREPSPSALQTAPGATPAWRPSRGLLDLSV